MAQTIEQIAASLGAQAFGDVDLCVTGLAEPARAGAGELALAMSPRYADALAANDQVVAAVVWNGADWAAMGLKAAIIVSRPRLAMAGLTRAFDVSAHAEGIHPTAVIDPTAKIGKGVAVGPFAVIASNVVIGASTVIAAHVTISYGAVIGANGQLHPGVRIGRNVVIGDHAILHPNVVIGADGFSFVTEAASNPEIGRKTLGKKPFTPPENPVQHRIHSLGSVHIGNNVEIGANSTVDAGTIRATHIGDGTKIDNLVQVGHNVRIGAHCLLCAQTAVAGSAVIGDRVVLGGKSGVADNLTVGADSVIGGAAIVLSDVPDGSFMMGYPAQPMLTYRAGLRAVRHAIAAQSRHKPVSNATKID